MNLKNVLASMFLATILIASAGLIAAPSIVTAATTGVSASASGTVIVQNKRRCRERAKFQYENCRRRDRRSNSQCKIIYKDNLRRCDFRF